MILFTSLVLIVVLLIFVAVIYRQRIAIFIATHFFKPPALIEKNDQETGQWFDDYYTVEAIDAQTYAIGEPRYHQQNFHYLFIGESRALLFDSGAGLRDISAVVRSLTALPVTVLPSHFHYDHVGGCERFDNVALADLPFVRAQLKKDQVHLSAHQHLGAAENIDSPPLKVNEWLKPGDTLDLGGRKLQVIHSPGHTPEHIVLFDCERSQLFSSDYLYDGPLLAFLPGGNLHTYLETAELLLKKIPKETRIFGAHRASTHGIPELAYSDLVDLRETLKKVISGKAKGKGVYPRTYRVNAKISLMTDMSWFNRRGVQ